MKLFTYGVKHGADYVPNRYTESDLEDWYDDATGKYRYICLYNRRLAKEKEKQRGLQKLKTE